MDNIITNIQKYISRWWFKYFSVLLVGFVFSQAGGWTSVFAEAPTVILHGEVGANPYETLASVPLWSTESYDSFPYRASWKNYVISSELTNVESIGFKYAQIDDFTGDPISSPTDSCPDGYDGNSMDLFLINTADIVANEFSFSSLSIVLHAYGTGVYNTFTGGCEYKFINSSLVPTSVTIPVGSYMLFMQSHSYLNTATTDTVTYVFKGSEYPFLEKGTARVSDLGSGTWEVRSSETSIVPHLDFYLKEVIPAVYADASPASCNPFSTSISNAFLNPDFSVYGCLNSIATFLFVPSQASVDNFTTMGLSDKFPFSYMSDIGVLYNELFANSGSSTIDIHVSTPIGTITFLNASMISSIPYTATIKLILASLLYLYTAMTIYKLILHSFKS